MFLNGCRTAGEIAGFAQFDRSADKFMGAGAGAFIGSLWAVRSSSAKLFAEELLALASSASADPRRLVDARQAGDRGRHRRSHLAGLYRLPKTVRTNRPPYSSFSREVAGRTLAWQT